MANVKQLRSGRPQRWQQVRRLAGFGQTYGAAATLVLLLLYNILFTPNFLDAQTLNINLSQVATIVIVATGMTLVIATGGIDLSVGSLMAISGALAPLIFLRNGLVGQPVLGVALACLLPMLAAGLFGLFNGMLITRYDIQPIIATLVVFIAGRGVAQVLTNGNLQAFNNPLFQFIGTGRVFGLPVQALVMVLVVIAAFWVVRSTIFGRYVLATGGNEAAARLAGVPIMRVKLAVYALSGVLAGLAGLIVIARNSASDANLVGLNMELDAIAAVAVGGTPLMGGRASIIGTLIGALIIQLIRFTLLAKGVPYAAAQIINAAIILLAVYVQRKQQS